MRIRPERPDDFDAIHSLVAAAFNKEDEARLVRSLRGGDGYVNGLALVAVENGVIVGHVLLTYVGLGERRILCLAPLAVVPEMQNKGIGMALTEAALKLADESREPLVIVTGHPSYYSRFGFESARAHGIDPPDDDLPDEVFMVKRLSAYDPSLKGRVSYPPTWEVV